MDVSTSPQPLPNSNYPSAIILTRAGLSADQYRLCSKKPGVNPTEECFQATPIEFHGEEQYIQWCANEQQFPMGYGAPSPPTDSLAVHSRRPG